MPKVPRQKQNETHKQSKGAVAGNTVTQGPGSIAQIGGSQNQATINNFGPINRSLSDSQEQTLINVLSSLPPVRVHIVRWQGGVEVQKFADQFVEAFKKTHWVIADDIDSLEPAKGTGLGVVVKSQEEHPLAADKLVLLLRGWGLQVEAGTDQKLALNEIRFVVAPNQ